MWIGIGIWKQGLNRYPLTGKSPKQVMAPIADNQFSHAYRTWNTVIVFDVLLYVLCLSLGGEVGS